VNGIWARRGSTIRYTESLPFDVLGDPSMPKMMQGDMKTFLSALVFFVPALVCPQLKAGPVYPNCVAGTLQSYTNSDCVLGAVGDAEVVFGGFSLATAVGTGGATVLDASQIEVTPTPAPGGVGGSFGFSPVSGDFTVGANQTVTYDIDYFLLLDPPPILGGGFLFLDPTGDVSVTESICADSFLTADDTLCEYNGPDGAVYSTPQSLFVDTSNPSASIVLDPAAYNFADVATEIVLTGGVTGASSAGVVVADTVYATPEPVTSLLCLGGLTAIGIFRRTRAKNSDQAF